jgi:DNA-binding NarL/FixJ family response regulator
MNRVALDECSSAARLQPAPEIDDRLRLLHVEDNVSDALLMQSYMQDALPFVTFDTVARLSDVTAERAATAHCALLDLTLPDATGLDALVGLRRISDRLPVIVLTGFDDIALGIAALRDGADDYLVKNHVDAYSLQRAVQYAIERRRLLLDLVAATAETLVATASSFAADAAAEEAVQRLEQSQEQRPRSAPLPTVRGTHAVAVRIDRESYDFVLDCQSCSWSSERTPDEARSWAARSLDTTLLRHVYFEGLVADGSTD